MAEARGQIAFGRTLADGSTISLLPDADLSTFLHESGHFFLEVLTDLASQPDAPAGVHEDMATLLDWFGVQDLSSWNGMTLDQRRGAHEQFARGIESYLFEGNAPTPGLQGIFQRFRSWLIAVYRSLSGLNVKLSDPVRQVMDRLIASSEDIAEARAARGMSMLFSGPDEAGMTPDEWESLVEADTAQSAEALDQLQARSLGHLRWLDNARDRAIRERQKEVAAERKAVRDEVTAEVDGEPVYRGQYT